MTNPFSTPILVYQLSACMQEAICIRLAELTTVEIIRGAVCGINFWISIRRLKADPLGSGLLFGLSDCELVHYKQSLFRGYVPDHPLLIMKISLADPDCVTKTADWLVHQYGLLSIV